MISTERLLTNAMDFFDPRKKVNNKFTNSKHTNPHRQEEKETDGFFGEKAADLCR